MLLIRISHHQRRIPPIPSPALGGGEQIIHYWVPLSKGEKRWKEIFELFVGNARRSVPYLAKEL